jgi:hypothetical protein
MKFGIGFALSVRVSLRTGHSRKKRMKRIVKIASDIEDLLFGIPNMSRSIHPYIW